MRGDRRAIRGACGNELVHAALVNAHPAVDPIDLSAVLLGAREESCDQVLGGRVVLLGDLLAVDGVRVRRLWSEIMEINPKFSIDRLERVLPYKDASWFGRFAGGLAAADLVPRTLG